MTVATELCEKIRTIYPEVGECGGDVEVHYEEEKNAWAVKLTQGQRSLTTYLDDDDKNSCLEGQRCVPLGVKVSQLIENVKNA